MPLFRCSWNKASPFAHPYLNLMYRQTGGLSDFFFFASFMIIEMLLNHCSLLKENIEPIYFLGILVLTLFFPSYALKLKNFFNLKQIIILNKKKKFMQ